MIFAYSAGAGPRLTFELGVFLPEMDSLAKSSRRFFFTDLLRDASSGFYEHFCDSGLRRIFFWSKSVALKTFLLHFLGPGGKNS